MEKAVKETKWLELERKSLDSLAAEKLNFDVDTYDECLEEYTDLTCQHCVCRETKVNYVREIERLTDELAKSELIIEKIAQSLADIDPNTANAEEGRALVRMMYEKEGEHSYTMTPKLPETPSMCIKMISGKVI